MPLSPSCLWGTVSTPVCGSNLSGMGRALSSLSVGEVFRLQFSVGDLLHPCRRVKCYTHVSAGEVLHPCLQVKCCTPVCG